jgi:hypothetical protein
VSNDLAYWIHFAAKEFIELAMKKRGRGKQTRREKKKLG